MNRRDKAEWAILVAVLAGAITYFAFGSRLVMGVAAALFITYLLVVMAGDETSPLGWLVAKFRR